MDMLIYIPDKHTRLPVKKELQEPRAAPEEIIRTADPAETLVLTPEEREVLMCRTQEDTAVAAEVAEPHTERTEAMEKMQIMIEQAEFLTAVPADPERRR